MRLWKPDMNHILLSNTKVTGRSPCTHGADGVTRFQCTPSVEFHTSRGNGPGVELNQPPSSHILPS